MNEKEQLARFGKALKDAFGKEANHFMVDLIAIPEMGTVAVAYIRGEKDFYLLFAPDSDAYEKQNHRVLYLQLLDIAKFLTVEMHKLVVPNQDGPTFWDGTCAFKFKSFIRF